MYIVFCYLIDSFVSKKAQRSLQLTIFLLTMEFSNAYIESR
jgi:hypothetical protein